MTAVEELKAAIDELTPDERGALCPYWHPDWEKLHGGSVDEAAPARVMEVPKGTEMTERVKKLKATIDALSPMEQCELNALVQDWPDDEWDKQMRADSEPGGKLHKLMLEAEEDAKAGRLRDWPEPPAG
jgi:hypothetical protein